MTFSFGLDMSWHDVIHPERDQGEWFTALREQFTADQWVFSVGEMPTWEHLLTADYVWMADGSVPDWDALLSLPPITDIAVATNTTLPYAWAVHMESALRALDIVSSDRKAPPVLTIVPLHPTDPLPRTYFTLKTSERFRMIVSAEWLLQRWCLHPRELRRQGYQLMLARTYEATDPHQGVTPGYMAMVVNLALQSLQVQSPASLYW